MRGVGGASEGKTGDAAAWFAVGDPGEAASSTGGDVVGAVGGVAAEQPAKAAGGRTRTLAH